MKLTLIRERSIIFAPVLLVLSMFFIPVSTSLKSIFLGLSVAAIILTPYFSKHILHACNTLWGRAALCFFIFILIACIWSPVSYSVQLVMIEKYCKLVFLPILAVVFIHPKTRSWTINSYLASMCVTCIISILKSKNIMMSGDPGEVFFNHIVTSFMMSFASYLAGLFALQYTGWRRTLYVILFLLMSYQILFVNTGRTGDIVYCILIGFLLLQKLTIKKAILAIVIFGGLIALTYQESSTLQERVSIFKNEIKALHHNNQNTSLGYRIQFHHYAQSLWEVHPIIGIGTGAFKERFAQDNPVPSWGPELTDPHSQYWIILTEQGLTGMIFYLFFLASLVITSLQLQETRPILWGILISFGIGSFSDTIFCFSTVGYLLIVISALCFGELIEKQAFKLTSEPSRFKRDDVITASI